jgi:hypothetical protein
MPFLLVTYDLNNPGKDYNDLLKTIDCYSWARLSESSYAIKTEQSPQQVFDRLKPFLDQNDYLYVINLKMPYIGFGLKEVNDWLNKNLT